MIITKEVILDFIDKNIWLHNIKAEHVKCAFKKYRNPRVKLMCLFLMIQKLYTMMYLLYQCYGENHDGRANMITWYQTQYGYASEMEAVRHY